MASWIRHDAPCLRTDQAPLYRGRNGYEYCQTILDRFEPSTGINPFRADPEFYPRDRIRSRKRFDQLKRTPTLETARQLLLPERPGPSPDVAREDVRRCRGATGTLVVHCRTSPRNQLFLLIGEEVIEAIRLYLTTHSPRWQQGWNRLIDHGKKSSHHRRRNSHPESPKAYHAPTMERSQKHDEEKGIRRTIPSDQSAGKASFRRAF